MILKLHSLSNYFVFLLLFFAVFSGNASIASLDFFFFTLPMLFLTLLLIRKKVFLSMTLETRKIAISFVILFGLLLAFIKSLYIGIPYINYPLWVPKVFFTLILFLLLRKNWAKSKDASFILLYTLGLVFFVVLMLLFGSSTDGRYSFIFGPNVLYRVLIFKFLLLILIIRNYKSVSFSYLELPLVIILALLIAMIGSRGAIVVLVITYLIISIRAVKSIKNALIFLPGMMLGFGAVLSVLEGTRVVNFEGLEATSRYVFFDIFFSKLMMPPVLGYQWQDFLPFASPGFSYPHNLFVELIFYYGCLGILLSANILWSLYLAVKKFNFKSTFYDQMVCLAFLVVLFSSMFSGDLTDNFSALALAFYMSMISQDKSSA